MLTFSRTVVFTCSSSQNHEKYNNVYFCHSVLDASQLVVMEADDSEEEIDVSEQPWQLLSASGLAKKIKEETDPTFFAIFDVRQRDTDFLGIIPSAIAVLQT